MGHKIAQQITRREVLAAAGAIAVAAAAGCGIEQRAATPSRVSILKAPAYDQSVYDIMRRLVAEHAGEVRGRNIVLKPNLVEFEPESSINTHPMLVHAAYEAFREMGAATVRIAEGPGHRRNTLDLADAAGYFHTIPGFEDVFTDLNVDDVSQVHLSRQISRLGKLYLPNTVLGADLLVSMPKMKTHHWVGATLAMKNLFGVVPGGLYGWPKNMLHWAGINESIVDLHSVFPRTFALVDGIVGMEGNGPIQGTPRAAGVIVTGQDMAAVDATCCRLMRIDPLQVEYLRLSRDSADLAESAIRQNGESIAGLSTVFELLPQFRSARL